MFNRNKINNKISPKIISFIGSKGGVGTSQIAFNTALSLSQDGYNVLYMDMDDRGSSISYSLKLGYGDIGLDTALKAMSINDFVNVQEPIVNLYKRSNLLNNDDYLKAILTKMPKTLDCLCFSENFIKRDNNNGEYDINFNIIKDLNLFLLMQSGYDAIIIDMPNNLYDSISQIILAYSNKIVFIITPDVSTISSSVLQLKLLDKQRINYIDKCYYILNKFEKIQLSYNDIANWLKTETKNPNLEIVTIPNLSKDCFEAIYLGNPILWQCRNKELQNSFMNIKNWFLN